MALKTSSTGQFMYPTAPAAGVSTTSGTASVFGSYVSTGVSTAAAVFIIGATAYNSSAAKPTYASLEIGTGSAGAESLVGTVPIMYVSANPTATAAGTFTPIYPWIPVATTTRVAVKTADSVGALTHLIQLVAINQANVVDGGVNESCNVVQVNTQTASAAGAVTFPSSIHSSGAAVASVTGAVSSVTAAVTLPSIPANWITAAGISSNAIATQATGIASSVGGSVSSVTAAITLPSIPANWITAAGISSQAIATQPTGIASSVTAAVTLPSIPANWITAAGVSSNAIATQATGIASSVAGSVSSVTAAITLPSIPSNWITAAGISSQAIATQPIGIASSVTAAVTLPNIPNNWITAAGVSSGAITVSLGTNAPTNWINAAAISSNAIATQPTGIASSVTAAVVLPTIPNNWITAAGVSSGAITVSLGTNAPSNWINAASVSSSALNGKGDWTVNPPVPDNASIAAIKAKTDQISFTSGYVNSNIQAVLTSSITGAGTKLNPWGPM